MTTDILPQNTNWNLIIKKAILAPLPDQLQEKSKLAIFTLSCIDLTSLNGSDNEDTIDQLCTKALQLKQTKMAPAAVCVYPVFVEQAKKLLNGTNIHIASVAGAFPSGQSPLSIREEEVKYAVAKGAEEIDMVISRGQLIKGNDDFVFNEIKTLKKACENAHLKVILETGELQCDDLIYRASVLAMDAGADFIKTSTGKTVIGATLRAAAVMMTAIKHFHEKTGIKTGIKIAGGISTAEVAAEYIKLANNILGEQWLNKKLFRIGASRLADQL